MESAIGLSVGMIVFAIISLLLTVGLMIWHLVLLVRKWKHLEQWAKVLYLVLLFLPGVGPIPSIIMLYLGVGVSKLSSESN